MRELQKVYGGLGEFEIDRRSLYSLDPAALQAMMFGLIVVSAEPYFEMDRMIYRAFGPDFAEVEPGAIISKYEALITKEEDGSYTVEWKPRA